MTAQPSETVGMKEAMQQALQHNNHSKPSTVTALIHLLGEAQEALRENGYADAVLELRSGLQTDYGLRYTAYLRNEVATFDNPLFSVCISGDRCSFQAEGQLEHDLDAESVIRPLARVQRNEFLVQVSFRRAVLRTLKAREFRP